MNEKIFESNRAAWNQATAYHQKALNHSLHIGFQDPAFSTFKRERDSVINDRLKQIDFSGKAIAHIPCNNGRELLSLMRLGAKEGVGVDISDVTSFFETGANHYSGGLDYFGNVKYESTEGFWFMHKMSEIISAILHNGMEMEEFEEYPFDLDGDYDQGAAEKFPFSYLITAKKK